MKELLGVVYKSNELIEAHYELSAVAQKIAASTISRVNPNDNDSELPIFFWTIEDLSKISGIKTKVLRNKLRSYTKELQSIVIEMRDMNSRSYKQLGLFRVFTYHDDKGVLEIMFEDKLAPHIRDFSNNFTKYQLQQLQCLVSGHSVRLYEILRMAYNRARVKQPLPVYERTVDELKCMLGIEAGAYKLFNNFKVRVLESAQRELSAKTDLSFEFELVKVGRKVRAIRFHVNHKEKFEEQDELIEGQLIEKDIPELNPTLKALILQVIPDMPEIMMQAFACYDQAAIKESIMDFMCARATGEVKKPVEYFVGILKKKKNIDEDQLAPGKRDRLDTSWADA